MGKGGKKKMDYKIAFEIALKWLPCEGVYDEVVNKANYDKAIENKNYEVYPRFDDS